MFCNQCGTKLPDNAQFCHHCGAKAFTEEKDPQKIQTESSREEPHGGQARIPAQPTQGDTIGASRPQVHTQNIPTKQGVPPASRGSYAGQSGYQTPYPTKQRPKWLLPLIAGASIMAALIIVIGVWTAIGSKEPEPAVTLGPLATEEPSSMPAVKESGEDEFQHYENSEVKFALEYPAGFSLSEPNMNNVLFGKDDQCRVAVEYAYITTKNCFIYSAEDFTAQIEQDPTVLSGWIGVDEVTMLNEQRYETDLNEHSRFFIWELTQNGKEYTGGIHIFDSKGEFGAYTFLWMIEKGVDDEELYTNQVQQMLESFEITGPHQAEGYTVYERKKPDYLRFALRDKLVQGEMDLEYDVLDNYVMISPVKSGTSQISMYTPSYMNASADPKEDKFSYAMDLAVKSFFDDKNYQDAGFTSQPTRLEIGRYPFIELDLQCRYTGNKADEDQNHYIIHFPRSGMYWQIKMVATEENLEQTAQVLVDFLMSLQIHNDGLEPDEDAFGTLPDFKPENYQLTVSSGDMNLVIEEILTKIESTSGFIKPDDYYQPLASFTDVDGNGVSELLVVYKTKQRNSSGFDDYNALYDVYAVKSDGSYTAVTIGQILYQEVGGNSGTLGLVVDKALRPYLKIETSSPQGDRFNDTIMYIPWGGEQSELEDDVVYLESHGTYGEEDKGQYILGDTKVDKAAFDARQTEFMSLWTDLDINRGPGNGGNNMSFSQIRSMDMNAYKFDSVG